MPDFIEVDFHDVETAKSGDAITLRYQVNGIQCVHVVDGGYSDVGERLLETIRNHYGNPGHIDRVILTHPDGDHAAGLKHVLENASVGELWMLRPWLYADELIGRFPTYTSVDRLRSRLRGCYPHVNDLEEIALRRGVTIREPFQGSTIGLFTVMAPTRKRYLDLIVASEKTPEGVTQESAEEATANRLLKALREAIGFVRAAWGEEVFSAGETSAENEMSVVQLAKIDGETMLLNGDAGRSGLAEAADYAPWAGLALPGVTRFQVPHHGSRRNVSTELLDRWLGSRLAAPPAPGGESFTGIISSAKEDKHHPRKAVVRAIQHRGGRVVTTEGRNICSSSSNAPTRFGWTAVTSEPYPEEQEPA